MQRSSSPGSFLSLKTIIVVPLLVTSIVMVALSMWVTHIWQVRAILFTVILLTSFVVWALLQRLVLRPVTAIRAAMDARTAGEATDRKSTRLNSSHHSISYAVFCLKK